MGTMHLSLIIVLLLTSLNAICDEKSRSFGIGIGSMYSGVGINYGIKSENSFGYFTIGATPYLGVIYGSEIDYDSGVGLGFLTTRFSKNNKHGIGINLGVYMAGKILEDTGVAYKAGINYSYLVKGLNKNGLNIGFTVLFEYFEDEINPIVPLSLGYQF